MDISQLIASLPVFQGFTEDEVTDILRIGEKQDFGSNVNMITEGEKSDDFFIVLSGQADVLKIEGEQGMRQFKLTTLSAGDVCGEMAFIDHLPRSSTVRTVTPVTVLRITNAGISQSQHSKEIRRKLMHNIAKTSIKRLRNLNDQYVNSMQTTFNIVQQRHNFGIFLVVIFFSLSIVTVSEYVIELLHYNIRSHWSTIVRLLLVCAPPSYWIWRVRAPLKDFGVSWKGWKMGLMEGTAVGLILAGLAIYIESVYSDVSFKSKLIEFANSFEGGFFWLLIYPLLAYFQEFMIRGVIQSSAQRFLNDTKGFYAVFVTAVIFGGMHIHRGGHFVVVAFIASMLMGLFYLHRQNLIGVTMIHMILGLIYLPLSAKYM